MFGILLSALNTVLAWLVRSVLVKFAVFFALYFVTTEFIAAITSILPNGSAVNGAMASVTNSTWYFLDVFMVQTGIAMVVSAYTTRFIIRRIPVIG
ncbi:DUF2523 family protein [Ideonella sp.]|jgi:hypothetical protein|uniref:DUF2523 family protein n=1 Tax=Ideonella sp. TaxID=1929293 RepID=UPI0037C18349